MDSLSSVRMQLLCFLLPWPVEAGREAGREEHLHQHHTESQLRGRPVPATSGDLEPGKTGGELMPP